MWLNHGIAQAVYALKWCAGVVPVWSQAYGSCQLLDSTASRWSPEKSLRPCDTHRVIRRVETDDWKRLRDVRLRALAADPEAFLETVATARAFPAEQWRERATPSAEQVTFAEERGDAFDGMVVGFVRGDAATAYLVGMWVAPGLRGSGVARMLVERVLAWAREHGRTRVLLSVEAGNDRAARLYEKCGFVELPEEPEMPYEPNPGNRFFGYEL